MKKAIVAVIIFFLIGSALLVFALPNQASDTAKDKTDRGPLTKITFIHYKKGYGKPGTICGNGICEKGENARKCPADCSGNGDGETSTCYGFLAKGAKWKTIEDYRVNTTNTEGLSGSFILSTASAGVDEWETYGGNIFGSQISDNTASYNNGDLDGENTLSFGSIPETGVIAVASVWGYFRGPPGSRELVEWDILLDQVDFEWGNATIDSSKMDVQNIVTHELGHAAGMGDLYQTECYLETMYGYSSEGETIKRDLYDGDIAGIKELYGS